MEEGELRRYILEAFRNMDQETRHISFEEIATLPSGKLSPQRSEEIEDHLAQCVLCRQQLQEYEQFVADTQKPAPGDLKDEWKELQRRLRPKKSVTMRRWLPAIAAAVILVAGLTWIAIDKIVNSPKRYLARAYYEKRTSPLRLVAGAAYSQVRIEKAFGSTFHGPPSFQRAQIQLDEARQAHPDDPETLRLYAEAEMITGEAAAAIKTLEHALVSRSKDARILADLGSAYALRGNLEPQPGDYDKALEYLSQSLKIQPKVPEVMFNRALVLEKLMLPDQAITEWRNYLELDGKGGWAKEAQEHLSDLQNKMKARKEALSEIQDDPAKFLILAVSGRFIDVEAYLKIAVDQWLPKLNSDETARKAAGKLAEILNQRGDSWLAEMIASGTGADMLAGLSRLADAEVQFKQGHAKSALAAAREADARFLHAHSFAGSFNARFKTVLYLKNSLGSEKCVAAAEKLDQELESHAYVLLQTRTKTEYGVCAMRMGDLGKAAALLQQAINTSRGAGFNTTALRAENMYLANVGHIGLQSEFFARAEQSLREFWDGAYPASVFYIVADELRDSARLSDESYTALFFARSVVWAATEDGDAVRVGPALANLSVAAQAVGEEVEARKSLIKSEEVFALTPPGYQLEPGMLLAKLELGHGEIDAALDRLKKLRSELKSGPSVDAVNYYAILGEAYRLKGSLPDAIDAFRQSTEFGSTRLKSQTGERERAGVLKTMERSYKGLMAATLASPNSDADALRIWQSYHALDSGVDINDMPSSIHPVLWFVELPEGFAGWLVRQDRVVMHPFSVPKDKLLPVIERFRRECSEPAQNVNSLRADAQQLYLWMIAPFAELLTESDSSLTVHLDGILTAVPIQALMSGNGQYLGDQFSVIVSLGIAPRGHVARPQMLGPGARALVIANPEVRGEGVKWFPPLEASSVEAEVVHETFARSIVLKGHDASINALVEGLAGADIVHYAGHGYANSDNGALVLAAKDQQHPYDLLRSADIQRQDWSRCRLVVLSACATAEGETRGAHNPDGLVRAMTKAGASNVVASLWNVDAVATAKLMRTFYAALARGEGPAQALRTAQRQMRQSLDWKHPYYWAGFQLYATT